MVFAVLLLMNLPFLLMGYMSKTLTENALLQEKENKLMALADILDSRLDPGGFKALLRMHEAENESREVQIRILHDALSASTEEVAAVAPGLGVGYYSRELDAILTYGPENAFAYAVGRSIPAEHPGRIVMETNRPLLKSGTMVRGDILNAMHPVERNGTVIGYIWVNELSTDVAAQFRNATGAVFLLVLFCYVVTIGAFIVLSRRTMRDVDRITLGVRDLRFDLGRRIPKISGELGEVADSINAMAADLDKASTEIQRAVSVLQNVMSNVDATIYVCDPQTKKLIYVNNYLSGLLGRDDLVGQPCYEAVQGYSEPCGFCPQRHFFGKDGSPFFTPVHSQLRYRAVDRDFEVTDRLIPWHDGRLLHMHLGTDVTERNALTVAEAANHAQRDFLARMSHEIRTPMNGVLGMTRLAMQAAPPPAQLEYLKKIQSSASLLLGIINDILDFSRIEAGKIGIEKHPFNLHAMVENIRELITPPTREKNLEFSVNMADSVPEYALGDDLRLSQVLLNMLGNATKFTSTGFVSLQMSAEFLPEGVLRLDCVIKDSGIGMSEEEQQCLFKPFSQADVSTSRKFGGTGLGLSICKTLVELMGGRIDVNSAPGKGSLFSFFVMLETLDRLPEDFSELSKDVEKQRCDGLAFLLVEDNAVNQEIALSVLSDLGAETDVADNGEEGVKAFLRKDYALILMDVSMPVMDGLEAARRIRASGKHDAASVPIIAMTANVMREDREASKEAGMNDHIDKPLDITELKKTLFRHLGDVAAK